MELKLGRDGAPGLAHRPDIDGLRGLAILPVVLYHAFPSMMPSGFIGVDIFFVISGFLISGIILKSLQKNTFSYVDFYARRIRRIFPALALVLAAVLGIGWITTFPSEYQRLGEHAAAGAGFVANLVFWRESGYFDAPELKPLLHLWSLGVEEQFYIFWPLLLAFLWKRTRRPGSAIIGIAIVSLALNIWLVRNDDATAAFYLPFTRFWELLAGALIAYLNLLRTGVKEAVGTEAMSLQKQRRDRMIADALSTAGAVLLVIGFAVIEAGTAFPGWWAALPVAGTALLIAAGPAAWVNRTVLSHPWMMMAGMISYPLYLWHWPLISLHNTLGWELTNTQIRFFKVAAVAVSFALAYFTYLWVETPVRKAKGFRYVPQLCSVVTVILCVSLAIYENHGFSGRFGSTQEQIARLAFQETDNKVDPTARVGTCFLLPGQEAKDFAPECIGQTSGSFAPKAVLIWGDSHAAHLYYGLRAALPDADTRLWQLTASSCPPILGYESTQRSGCADINRYVLEKVRQLRPGTVLLHAYWWHVPFSHFSRGDLPGALSATITELKSAGVARVILVGPVPIFNTPQPKLIALAMVGSRIPPRLKPAELESQLSLDVELSEIAAKARAEYVSPLSLECDAADCLVALRSKVDGIMAYDYGHLTPQGSEFVARSLLLPRLESR